jgi:hypothetical protein
MESRAYPRSLGGEEWLDLCWNCQAIWFDTYESTQLTPAGVVALFKEIHENRQAARPVADNLKCPRCAGRLGYRGDISKSGRFSYYHCSSEHGRFTPFNQFLIEKGFIRALTIGEIATLKAQIQIVRCSGCGAAVDLQHDTVCSYCHAPIAVLDSQAVEKALAAYEAAGKPRPVGEHDMMADILQGHERNRAQYVQAGPPDGSAVLDLVASSMESIFNLLR